MGWRRAFCSLFFVFTLVESTSSSGKLWTLNLGADSLANIGWPIFSASIFVLVALALSTYLIFEHLVAYNQPEEQKFLIGLILMVPVYSLESFLSLLDSSAAFNFEAIRDCYEAFAMYCFERYLIACLGGEENTIQFMESKTLITSSIPLLEESYAYGVVEHPFPLNCFLRDWQLGPDFYHAVKVGIVQYMILKLICALLAMVLEAFGVYGEGKFEWRYGHFSNVSVSSSGTEMVITRTAHLIGLISETQITDKTKQWLVLPYKRNHTSVNLYDKLLHLISDNSRSYLISHLVKQMGIAAVVHLHVFPAVPYKRGERCVRNVAVMTDYASIGSPLDPEEVQDCERYSRLHLAWHDDREKRLNLPESVCDVVLGSGEIVRCLCLFLSGFEFTAEVIVDDMKYTVSHVVEPVERGIAKINRTFHQISENVKRHEEERKRSSKDDNHLVPLNSWTKEFSEAHDNLLEGSVSDSGLSNSKRPPYQSKATASRARTDR
ncbi:hypothetical protein GH714_000359 [Hevea brasiliensis]|uniref:Uncharacterized protein n=1 Tax=Hevea brasiliensis TaxID=3981 RepID=A0A6A6L6H1_HEVBR|nr:hypothetical protein GH714_000359 [Hevea brasiliensis]